MINVSFISRVEFVHLFVLFLFLNVYISDASVLGFILLDVFFSTCVYILLGHMPLELSRFTVFPGFLLGSIFFNVFFGRFILFNDSLMSMPLD